MTLDNLEMIRLFTNAGLSAVCIIFAFAEIANYITHKKTRHIVGMVAGFIASIIFLLRALGMARVLEEDFVMTTSSLLWLAFLIAIICWGIMILIEKWKQAIAIRKVIKEQKNDEIFAKTIPQESEEK